MTITGSMIRLTPVGDYDRPVGISFREPLEFGFEDDDLGWTYSPDTLQRYTLDIEIREINPAAMYLITGSRRVFGWPRKLAVNGHEYNRRRRSR